MLCQRIVVELTLNSRTLVSVWEATESRQDKVAWIEASLAALAASVSSGWLAFAILKNLSQNAKRAALEPHVEFSHFLRIAHFCPVPARPSRGSKMVLRLHLGFFFERSKNGGEEMCRLCREQAVSTRLKWSRSKPL